MQARNGAWWTAIALAAGVAGCTSLDNGSTDTTSIEGTYVIEATAIDTATASPYWPHLAAVGDTFQATVGANGLITLSGMRVAGYDTPGITLAKTGAATPTFTGTGAGRTLTTPTFFNNYLVTDTDTVVVPASGDTLLAVATTAAKSGSSLGDTAHFDMHAQPTIGSAAGHYRLTVITATGGAANAMPTDATLDGVLNSDSSLTINVDPTLLASEVIDLFAPNATTLKGQYSRIDDAGPSATSFPITLTLVGGVPSTGTLKSQPSSGTTENYTLDVEPISAITAFHGTGLYHFFGGTKTGQFPANMQAFVDAIAAATGPGGVAAQITSTIGSVTPSDDANMIVDSNLDSTLDTSDLHFPIGMDSGAGKLVFSDIDTTSLTGTYSGLTTTVTWTFTKSGSSSLSAGTLSFSTSTISGSISFSVGP